MIFASSIIAFPQTVASFFQKDNAWISAVSEQLRWGMPLYNLLYVSFIIFFCYFYTAVSFNPVDVADNMKKYGGFVPGIRPGRRHDLRHFLAEDHLGSKAVAIPKRASGGFAGAIHVGRIVRQHSQTGAGIGDDAR